MKRAKDKKAIRERYWRVKLVLEDCVPVKPHIVHGTGKQIVKVAFKSKTEAETLFNEIADCHLRKV